MAYYIKYFAIKKVLTYINSNFKVPNFIVYFPIINSIDYRQTNNYNQIRDRFIEEIK